MKQMKKYLTTFDTHVEYSAATLDYPNVSLIREDDSLVYVTSDSEDITGVTPTFDVTRSPMTAYTATTYDDVYCLTKEASTSKWYKLTTNNEYEEYGLYGEGRNIPAYEGKLTVDGDYEYQYSGGSWVNVGEVSASTSSGVEYTKELSMNTSFGFRNVVIPTSFKISKSDVVFTDISFSFEGEYDQTTMMNPRLQVNYFGGTWAYSYSDAEGSPTEGTVTDDGTYYVFSIEGIDSFNCQYLNWQDEYYTLNVTFNASEIGTMGSQYESQNYFYSSLTIPTSFKIPTSDVDYAKQMTGSFNISMSSMDGSMLSISDMSYSYSSSMGEFVEGTVTLNGDYYEYSLSNPSDFQINTIDNYMDNVFVHIVVGGGGGIEVPVHYTDIAMPTITKACATTDEMSQSLGTFYGQYAVVDDVVYVLTTDDLWVETSDYGFYGKYENNKVNVALAELDGATTEINSDVTMPWYVDSLVVEGVIGNVDKIGFKSFEGCSGITSITIPDSVTSFDSYVFNGCSGLTSITIPSGVTSIGGGAFMFCSSLTSVTIPSGVTSIDSWAFMGCSGLTFIEVPSGVTSIGATVFSGCSSLTSVTINNGVRRIGDGMFSNCSSLRGIEIPDSVTSIGGGAFSNCSGLTSIDIPSGVTSIGNGAFIGCSSLTSIEIPSGVTSISASVFSGCSSLTSIEIPSGVTSIGNGAFQYCSGLTSIDIPSGVTSIGYGAFNHCSNLTSITIPSGVTNIDNMVFSDCSSLTSINIPSGVTNIGYNAFENCSRFIKIDIPSGVRIIGSYSFRGCSSLTSVTINATTPPTLNNQAFNNTNNCPIYVPSESVETYKAKTGWKTYASRIQAIP